MRASLPVLATLIFAAVPAVAAPRPTVSVVLDRGGYESDELSIPAYGGSARRWSQVVGCVQRHFAPFRVDIGTQMPASGRAIHVVVGGRPSMVGLEDETTTGISPWNGGVIRNALVHVFSEVTGEDDAQALCDVAAHEIGHALGLDHSSTCGDLMSYSGDECGAFAFRDVDAPCGEYEERTCGDGAETQNSWTRLVGNVGLRAAPEAAPAPVLAEPEDPYASEPEPDDSFEPDEPADLDDSDDLDDGDDSAPRCPHHGRR